jgi:hypothetical protein
VAPVEHAADAFELPPEVRDVPRNQLRRIDADLDGVVLTVDAERVVADGFEDLIALQPFEPAVHVAAGEGEHVPHVQPLGRGIGEHHQVVEGLDRAIEVGLVDVPVGPARLPLGLDGLRTVGHHVGRTWILLHSRLGRLHDAGSSRRRPGALS